MIVSPPGGVRAPSTRPAAPAAELAALLAPFEAAPVGVYIADEAGILLAANPAFAALTGAEVPLGARLADLPNEASRAGLVAHHGVVFAGGADAGVLEWSPSAGGRRTLRERTWMHTLAGGQRLRVALVEDVTEVRRMEARERLFRVVMTTLPVIFFALDAEGRYTDAEGAALRKLGIDPQQMVGTSCLEQVRGTEGEAHVRRALGGEAFTTTMMYPNPEGGGDLHYQSFYVPLRGSGGEVEGTIGLSLDVTGERRTEHALREQLGIIEAQSATLLLLGRILRATPLLLVGLDRRGVVTLAEGEGFALVGMECAAAVGQNALELFPENTFVEACIRALGGEEQRVTAPLRDGVWFDSWFLPMRDDRGDVTGITIFGVDATERKLAEHELRDKLQLIERQSATIRALATPIIKVWNEILCLPVVGTLDSARTAEMMDSLLQAIVREQARFAIIDLTGVEIVDTSTADHIIQLFRAASVLGVEGILCGIRPAVAQTVVALGVDLTQIHTMRTLEDALRFCLRSGAATAKEERSAKPRAGAKGAKGATGLTAPRRR